MLKGLLFVSFLSVFLVACGDGGGSGGNPDGQVGEWSTADLGYNPAQRWTEKGNYSYQINYTYNGQRCVTQQTFSTQAAYCLGLQDQALNENCALEIRQERYQRECGNDFQELNLSSGFWKSGYDSDLGKVCETGRVSKFKTIRHYCAFLKDEASHGSCFWQDRRSEFQRRDCSGAFSEKPVSERPLPPQEPPAPTNPGPGEDAGEVTQPEPQDPLDRLAVVRVLRANGIDVEVDWQAIRSHRTFPRPGEPSHSPEKWVRLAFVELQNNVDALIARKQLINKVSITIYTNYSAFRTSKVLNVNFQSKPDTLALYFPLLDKALKYQADLDIRFNFIHDGVRSEYPYKPLVDVLRAVEGSWKDLVAAKGMIREIELAEFDYYFSPSKILKLRYKNVREDLVTNLESLKPLMPVYNWAQKNNVEIEAEFDLKKEREKVLAGFAQVQKALPALNNIAEAGMIKRLGLSFYDNGSVSFWSTLQLVRIALGESGKAQVASYLTGLGELARMKKELGRDLKVNSEELNAEFTKTVQLMSKVWPKVKAKSQKIKTIQVSAYGTSSYYASLELLVFGGQSSQKDTETVISKIP